MLVTRTIILKIKIHERNVSSFVHEGRSRPHLSSSVYVHMLMRIRVEDLPATTGQGQRSVGQNVRMVSMIEEVGHLITGLRPVFHRVVGIVIGKIQMQDKE